MPHAVTTQTPTTVCHSEEEQVDDRQAHGVEGLVAAIAIRAVDDLQSRCPRIRRDAVRFFMDGRFDFIADSLPSMNADAAREKLRRDGLLPPEADE